MYVELTRIYKCINCDEDIIDIRIRCIVCVDVDICLECFRGGAEIGKHKRDHWYKIIPQAMGTIFSAPGNWTGSEELQLLEYVDNYGYGNWSTISERIKSPLSRSKDIFGNLRHTQTKSPKQIEDEYVRRYVVGNVGIVTRYKCNREQPDIIERVNSRPESPVVCEDFTTEEAYSLGYNPKRDTYIWEYDSNAEKLISCLQVNINRSSDPDSKRYFQWSLAYAVQKQNDLNYEKASESSSDQKTNLKVSQVESELQWTLLKAYNRRLKARIRRKRMVRDYKLISEILRNSITGGVHNSDYYEPQQLKIFRQFFNCERYQTFLRQLFRSTVLRRNASDLIHEWKKCKANKQHNNSDIAPCAPQRFGYSTISPYELKESLNVRSFEASLCPASTNCSPTTNLPITLHNDILSDHELKFCDSIRLDPYHYKIFKHIVIENDLSPESDHSSSALAELRKRTENKLVVDLVTNFLRSNGWVSNRY